ncbi:protein FAM149B1 isoform X2 [Engraulis encrasicolus]|uniref:protein FAM149B1 isoform X2 n=1 Tax=Engraulis encrasicolus TaxID=184585 RepID=UPI002FD5828D
MISRYTRRPVSHNLQIRGLSRSSLDHHPPPEEAEDDDGLPQPSLHDLHEAVSTYNSSGTSVVSERSGCQTVTTGDTGRSWSGIHSYAGTGISTERSSVFSWGYDEFDKAASRQVQQMFEEIDEQLYEGRGRADEGRGRAAARGLQEECSQWASRFPHLRILGRQLVCPTDDGFQWYATESGKGDDTEQQTRPASKDTKEKPSSDLCVQGRRAVLSRSCVELVCPSEASVDRHGNAEQDQEAESASRVIEEEGLMEEYLAYDCRDLEEEWVRECVASRRRRCLPPVSPYRCRREAVLDLLFDDVWRQLVGWMEDLVRRHWEGDVCVLDDEKTAGVLSPTQPDSQNPFLLLSSLPTVLPRLGHGRHPQLTAGLQPQSSRVPVGASVTHGNLNDLIMIHGIPLQQRNVGVLDRVAQECEERGVYLRPGSSALPSGKPRARRPLEQSSSSLFRPPQSARRRNPPPRTLMPLAAGPGTGPGLAQSSVAGSMEEVIRGTRLTTASDRLTSPPMPLSRNTLLPPIGTCDAEHTHTLHARHTQRQRGCSSRAHSAVTEEAASMPPRDRLHLLDYFSRPNTTHTFRSDTPYRRSFTVLDSSGQQGRPGRASVGTDSLGIGVTGISLGISSSSFLDSFTHHPHSHSPIEDEDEELDALTPPPPALLVPVSVPAARSHGRGGGGGGGGGGAARSSRPGL